MKRTFIGIKIQLEPELEQVVKEVKERLADERINWVPDENLHITLHFLGETTDLQIKEIVHLMHTEIIGKNTFSFRLGGLSYFRRHTDPSALFLSVYDTDELTELVDNLNEGLQKMGFKTGHSFKPHLTIGRIKKIRDKTNFYETVHSLQHTTQQSVEVGEVILYESLLQPTGPVYKPIDIIYLEG